MYHQHMTTNRYGLSRDIPDAVRREVRRRCFFGCVICGCAIYQYEHLSPPFAEAASHDPSAIVLLCGGCHDRVSRGFLSNDAVAAAAMSPKARQIGYSFDAFDVGQLHPTVVLGPLTTVRTTNVVKAFGVPLLGVQPPEADGGPFRLSALLCDADGRKILSIVDNEWRTPIDNWDVEVFGGRIVLRRASHDVTLRLRTDPPHRLIVEKLRMYYQGVLIECAENSAFRVTRTDGTVFECSEMTAVGCETAVAITETNLTIGYLCEEMRMAIRINPSD